MNTPETPTTDSLTQPTCYDDGWAPISILQKIGGRLAADLKQNDHYTAEPMFCLQIKVRTAGLDDSISDNQCWHNPNILETIYDDDTEDRKQDLGFMDDPSDWDGPYGYLDNWKTVMVALTQEGIDRYMKANGHNVKRQAFRGKTRTYVESFHRCAEMIELRKALITLAKAENGQSILRTPKTPST